MNLIIHSTVASTRSSPHETRTANAMRTHRNIPVFHFKLNDQGKAVKVPLFPNALAGAITSCKYVMCSVPTLLVYIMTKSIAFSFR